MRVLFGLYKSRITLTGEPKNSPIFMHKASAVFAFLVLAALVFVFFNRKSGADQKLIELDKKYQYRLDSITGVYRDSLHKRELFALKVFSDAQRSADRWEGEARHWKAKYNHEKNSNRHFSDTDLDSLISSIR